MSSFGLLLKERRECIGYSVRKLGKETGLDPTYVSSLERNSRKYVPSLKTISKLCNALDVTSKYKDIFITLASNIRPYNIETQKLLDYMERENET